MFAFTELENIKLLKLFASVFHREETSGEMEGESLKERLEVHPSNAPVKD